MNEVSFGNGEELKFILQCYRKPDNSEDQKYFKMILGEGTFQLMKALNPDEYYVLLETNLPFERETSNQ